MLTMLSMTMDVSDSRWTRHIADLDKGKTLCGFSFALSNREVKDTDIICEKCAKRARKLDIKELIRRSNEFLSWSAKKREEIKTRFQSALKRDVEEFNNLVDQITLALNASGMTAEKTKRTPGRITVNGVYFVDVHQSERALFLEFDTETGKSYMSMNSAINYFTVESSWGFRTETGTPDDKIPARKAAK